jgi:hypothetical protein
MLRRFGLTGWTLLLILLGLSAFMAGCASATPSGTPAPTGRPTLLFFYTDA